MKKRINGLLALLLVLITQFTFAQDINISGIVSDSNGLPISGANVKVKGTSVGTQTDFDGSYKIKAASNATLVYSFTGMNSQELKVSGAKMNARLTSKATELEGVVVTALGVKKQKKSLGYATVTVTGKDLTEVNNTNVFSSLSGKLAGVDVTAPAQVGASTKVVIRGFSSLTSNDPLYVIDGTPINNAGNGETRVRARRSFDAGTGIGDIDPSNIETMTVLKGAAATALYGSRAGSGAIIITTKSGKNNSQLRVDISSTVELSQVLRVPHQQYDYGQGWTGLGYSGFTTHGVNVSAENGSWGPAFNGEIRPWGTIVNNTQQIKPYVGLKNNIKDFYTSGNTFTNNLRVSGGGEKSNFSLGFSDVNSDGVIPTNVDSYKRRNLNLSAGMNTDKLSVKVNVNYVKKDQSAVNTGGGDNAGEGNTLVQELLQIPSDISLVDLKDYNNNPFNTSSNYFSPYTSNPYFTIGENSTRISENRLFGNVNFLYKFNEHFSATYQIGGDYRNGKIKSYGAKIEFEPGSSQALNVVIPTVGGVTESNTERGELDSFLNFNYTTKLSEDVNFNGLVGFNANERKTDFLQASITKLDLANYYELSNTAEKPIVTQSNLLRRNLGFYASLETSYKDCIYLTLTGRNDYSSTLPVKNNSYFYPSASLSGIVVDNNKTFFKLRGAWAKVSKDTDAYRTQSTYVQAIAGANFGTINFPIGGVNAYEQGSNLGNGELKPETTVEAEFGFESSFLSKRINLDASIYDKRTTDLLYNRAVAVTTGFRTQTGNILDVTNKGIEIVLNIVPVRTANFTWNINTTFTKNISKVDRIIGDSGKIELTNTRGVTFNAIVGEPLGVFQAKVPKLSPTGQFIVDGNGYYVPTDDQQNIGTSQRDFVAGLQNKLSYKGLTLSFAFDWKQGGRMFSETKYLAYFTGNGIETTYNNRNGFVIPNSVTEVISGSGAATYIENSTPINTFAPIAPQKIGVVTDFYNAAVNQTIAQEFLVDKTFVRLRDISLTYNISSKFAKRVGLVNASLSVYGTNLFLWTPAKNAYVDPEISTFGTGVISEFGESFGTPSQSSYGTTIKLTF